MATVGGWSNGGLEAMLARLDDVMDDMKSDAQRIMRETIDETLNLQIKILEDAHTKTGIRRVATNGASSRFGSTNPGRVDSGNMVEKIDSRVFTEGETVVGEWGWDDGDFEKYMARQENDPDYGTHSHLISRLHGREILIRKLSRRKGA